MTDDRTTQATSDGIPDTPVLAATAAGADAALDATQAAGTAAAEPAAEAPATPNPTAAGPEPAAEAASDVYPAPEPAIAVVAVLAEAETPSPPLGVAEDEAAGIAGTEALPHSSAPVSDGSAAPDRPRLAPRTRWAAIIWGAMFAAVAGFALWITVSEDRRTAIADWTLTLSPGAIAAYVVLAIGAVALVAGLVGLVRRAQRALEARRT